MKKKYTILTIGLLVFLVLVYILYTPSISDSSFKEKNTEDNDKEKTQVKDDVNLIDYLNLEGENRKLREEIDSLEYDIFELKKVIAYSEPGKISHYYNTSDFLYKKVKENEIIMLIRDETDGDYRLTVSSKEEDLFSYFNDLKNNEVINYTGTDGFYSGLINGNEISHVIVKVNEKSYKAEIVNFTDNISFWYIIYEHKKKVNL